jgi:hypothetical protein
MTDDAFTRGAGGRRPVGKRPAHPPVQTPINRPEVVFVTLCTHLRRPVLACSCMHDLLRPTLPEPGPGRSLRGLGIVALPGRTEHPDVA